MCYLLLGVVIAKGVEALTLMLMLVSNFQAIHLYIWQLCWVTKVRYLWGCVPEKNIWIVALILMVGIVVGDDCVQLKSATECHILLFVWVEHLTLNFSQWHDFISRCRLWTCSMFNKICFSLFLVSKSFPPPFCWLTLVSFSACCCGCPWRGATLQRSSTCCWPGTPRWRSETPTAGARWPRPSATETDRQVPRATHTDRSPRLRLGDGTVLNIFTSRYGHR